MGLSFTNRQTVQFKKNRTAGQMLEKTMGIATSQSVQSPCNNVPQNVLLADGSLLVNTFGFLLL